MKGCLCHHPKSNKKTSFEPAYEEMLYHVPRQCIFVGTAFGMTCYDKIKLMTVKMQLCFCLVSRRRPVSRVHEAPLGFEIVKLTHLSTHPLCNHRMEKNAHKEAKKNRKPTLPCHEFFSSCVHHMCVVYLQIYGSLNCQGWDLLSLLWANRFFSQAWWSICGPRGSKKLVTG